MFARAMKHIFPPLSLKRAFNQDALSRIESCIAESEREHSAEIRFAVDLALTVPRLLRNETPRHRALEVFSRLKVWDTEGDCGVLIYLLLAEHAVEIIADRGAFRALGQAHLDSICREIEQSLSGGNYVGGICAGISRLGKLLATEFPPEARSSNQLSDKAEILR